MITSSSSSSHSDHRKSAVGSLVAPFEIVTWRTDVSATAIAIVAHGRGVGAESIDGGRGGRRWRPLRLRSGLQGRSEERRNEELFVFIIVLAIEWKWICNEHFYLSIATEKPRSTGTSSLACSSSTCAECSAPPYTHTYYFGLRSGPPTSRDRHPDLTENTPLRAYLIYVWMLRMESHCH